MYGLSPRGPPAHPAPRGGVNARSPRRRVVRRPAPVPADAVAVGAGGHGWKLAEQSEDLLVPYALRAVEVVALNGRVGLWVEGGHGRDGAHDHAHGVGVVAEGLEVLGQVLVDKGVPQHARLPVAQLGLGSRPATVLARSQARTGRVSREPASAGARQPPAPHLVWQLAMNEQKRHLQKRRLFDELFDVVPAVPGHRGPGATHGSAGTGTLGKPARQAKGRRAAGPHLRIPRSLSMNEMDERQMAVLAYPTSYTAIPAPSGWRRRRPRSKDAAAAAAAPACS